MELIITNRFGKTETFFFDAEDLPIIQQYKWCIFYSRNCVYARAWFNGTYAMMHNLLMGGKGVDHIDGNGRNNTRANLRFATITQNLANTFIRKDNTTGFKGVQFNKKTGKYVVTVVSNRKRVNCGVYQNIVDAAIAYNKMAKILFGEFARLNEISESLLKEANQTPHFVLPKSLTGYRGVTKTKSGFVAEIAKKKKRYHLGVFSNPIDAAKAYNDACIKLGRPFQYLNTIPE